MDVEQQANDVRLEADRQRLDYRNFMDDEEVTLLHHKRDMDVPDNPGLDVRDGPDTSDTQQEDWLLQTEPLITNVLANKTTLMFNHIIVLWQQTP